MPNPNFALNYDDFMRQVNPLLNGGNSWQQKDGDPYGLNLQLADGRTWNPSGASSGVQYTPKGSRLSGGEWRDSGEGGGYMTPEVLANNDTYEVSGDMSALNGAPNSRQHTNVRYERQGDQLVPVNQTDWQWASPYDSMRKAAMAAAAIYGVGTGLEAFGGASGGGAGSSAVAGGGSAAGGSTAGTGLFNAAVDSQLANAAIGADALAGYTIPASAATYGGAPASSGLLGTAAEALNALKTATGLSTADLLKLGGGIAGGLLGSQSSSPNKALSQSLMNTPIVGNPFADGRASLRQPNFNFGGWQPR